MMAKTNYCTPHMLVRVNHCLRGEWPWPLNVSVNGITYNKIGVDLIPLINDRNSLVEGVIPYNNKLVKVGLLCKEKMSGLSEFRSEFIKRVDKKLKKQETKVTNKKEDTKAVVVKGSIECELQSSDLVTSKQIDIEKENSDARAIFGSVSTIEKGSRSATVEWASTEKQKVETGIVSALENEMPVCILTGNSNKKERAVKTVPYKKKGIIKIMPGEVGVVTSGESENESVKTTSAMTPKKKKIDYKRIARRAIKFGRPNPFDADLSVSEVPDDVSAVESESVIQRECNAYNIMSGKFVYAKPEYVSGRQKRVHIFAGYSGCGKTSSIASLVSGSCVTVVCAPGGMCKSSKEDVGPVLMQAYQRSAQLKALRNVSVREVLTYNEIMGRHFEGILIIDDAHMLGTSELIATIMRAKDDVYVSYGVNQRGSRWRLASMLRQLDIYNEIETNFTWLSGGFAQHSDSEIENCKADCTRHGIGSQRACYADDIRTEDMPQMFLDSADGIVICVMFSYSFRTCGNNRYYKVPQHTSTFMYMGTNMYALADKWRTLCDGWGAVEQRKKLEHRVWDECETIRFTINDAERMGWFIPRLCTSRIVNYRTYGGGSIKSKDSYWVRGIDGKVKLEDDVIRWNNHGYEDKEEARLAEARLEQAQYYFGLQPLPTYRHYDR